MVRHRILVPASVGSSPSSSAKEILSGYRIRVITLAFQAKDTGSNPVIRSNF